MKKYAFKAKTFRVSETPAAVSGPMCPDTVVTVLRQILAGVDADREHFIVLALDTRGCVSGFKVVSTGTLGATLVHPREVFQAAVILGAHSIIVAHNHPSGDPTPSMDDMLITIRLRQAGDILGVPVLDHIVLGRNGHRHVETKS